MQFFELHGSRGHGFSNHRPGVSPRPFPMAFDAAMEEMDGKPAWLREPYGYRYASATRGSRNRGPSPPPPRVPAPTGASTDAALLSQRLGPPFQLTASVLPSSMVAPFQRSLV